MSLMVLYALVFISVLVGADALIRVALDNRARANAANRKLAEIPAPAISQAIGNRAPLVRADPGWRQQAPFRTGWRLWRQSGLAWRPSLLLFQITVLVLGIVLVAGLWVPSVPLRIVVSLLVAAGVASVVILLARSRRIRAFSDQLAEALDIANRSLSAGHPLVTAIALAGREMAEPLGGEFRQLADELTYGVPLEKALSNMRERVGADDLDLLSIALGVQSGTGGNLVELLANLSSTLKARAMLRGRVRAISSEGRITAVFMSVYPFLLYMLLATIAPTYFDPFWQSNVVEEVLAVIAIVMVAGNLILYKLVNFRY